jgi:MFS family permease
VKLNVFPFSRFGGKAVYGWCMLVTAIATLLTPIGARGSPWILVALRVIEGLGEGVVFPAMHCLWSKWAPPLERSKLIGFTYAGWLPFLLFYLNQCCFSRCADWQRAYAAHFWSPL